MKRCYLLLLLVGLAVPSMAQDSIRLARKEHRAEIRQEMLSLPRSQFRAGVGVRMGFGSRVLTNDSVRWVKPQKGSLTPVFSIEYSYRVWNFLEVGLSLGYARSLNEEYLDLTTNQKTGTHTGDNLNVSILVRYSWFNRRWVSLYSSLGIWGNVSFDRETLRGETLHSTTRLYVYPDVSPIGVRVGRRFFGYFEPFCFGGRGMFIQAGLGYKF